MKILVIMTALCWLVGLGGNVSALLCAIVVTIPIFLYYSREHRFHNYMPPENKKIDYGKMENDLSTSKINPDEVKNKTLRGDYNVEKDKKCN